MSDQNRPTSAYAAAGVDIEAGDRAVELMKAHVARSHRPEVLGGLGGFAGFFDASAFKSYRHPVLATSTDGVGTKVAIAQAMDVHDTIGWDLIGMLVDDLVVVGAEPLFVTDYIACGKVVPERIAAIVKGIAEACTAAGASLLGGETAEHPGLLSADEYDKADRQYFPMPGDSPEVLVQKERNRQLAVDAMIRNAGQSYRQNPLVGSGSPSDLKKKYGLE